MDHRKESGEEHPFVLTTRRKLAERGYSGTELEAELECLFKPILKRLRESPGEGES
jgi:hypothetical protein